MSRNALNLMDTNLSTSSLIKSKSKNAVRNRFDIGWKHEFYITGNRRFKYPLAGTREDSKSRAFILEETLMIK